MALTDNILAYWKLDNDGSGGVSLLDSTPNSYTLTNTNVDLGDGKILNGASFSDTSSTLNASTSFGLNNFSISAWIRTSSSGGFKAIAQEWDGGNGWAYFFGISPDGLLHTATTVDLNGITSSAQVNDGIWHLVTMVCNATTGDLLQYVDGSLTNSTNYGPFSISPSLMPLTIGSDLSQGITGFDGNIDEIGVWGRPLTSGEITNLYNNGTGRSYPFGGLYFNAAVDGDLDNLLNWWSDSIFTIQASALPTSASAAYLYANASYGDLSCFSATLQNSIISGAATITGAVTLNGTSGNAATINGNAIFNANSYQDASGVVNGNAQFFNTTGNIGTITGNATFRDSSGNSYDGSFGTVEGNAIVCNPSTNPIVGTVLGTVTYEWPNGTGLWSNEVWIDGSASFIIPSESDVRAGVEYGPANSPYTGTYTSGGSGGNNGIDLAKLIGLPPFIKL